MRTSTCYSFACLCAYVVVFFICNSKNSWASASISIYSFSSIEWSVHHDASVMSLVARRLCGILSFNSFVHLQQKFFILPFYKMINRIAAGVCVLFSLYVRACVYECRKWMHMLCMLQLSCAALELHVAHFKDNASADFGVSMKMLLLFVFDIFGLLIYTHIYIHEHVSGNCCVYISMHLMLVKQCPM